MKVIMAKDSAFIPALKAGDFPLRPSQSYKLNDGEEVRIKVQGSATRKIRGIVKCWEGLEVAHEDYESNIH